RMRSRVPALPHGHVPRPRLHAPLGRGAAITLVRAPYGAGKTTLVSEWLRTRTTDEVHAWAVVPLGADRAQFWRAVQQALEISDTDGTDPMAAVSEMLERVATPVVLVIDAFEQVDDPLLYDELAQL